MTSDALIVILSGTESACHVSPQTFVSPFLIWNFQWHPVLLLNQVQQCSSFLKRFTINTGSLSPIAMHSKELPYCRRMCEWKSSLHPGFIVLIEDGGWVC